MKYLFASLGFDGNVTFIEVLPKDYFQMKQLLRWGDPDSMCFIDEPLYPGKEQALREELKTKLLKVWMERRTTA